MLTLASKRTISEITPLRSNSRIPLVTGRPLCSALKMRGLSAPKEVTHRQKWGVVAESLEKVWGEQFLGPLQAFKPLLTNSCPAFPRKNPSNTWGKVPSFPSFLGCCLSERLGYFVFRKMGLKRTAWSDKIFVVLRGTGASVGQKGNPGNPWSSLSWRSRFRGSWRLPQNPFHAWAPPKSAE